MNHINGRYPIGNYMGEVIPEIPWGRSCDPLASRDPILSRAEHQHEPGKQQIISHYDERRNELVILCRCTLPSNDQLNEFLTEGRKIGHVKRVTLFVCQELYRESFAWFRHRGFERHEHREGKHAWFVLVRSEER